MSSTPENAPSGATISTDADVLRELTRLIFGTGFHKKGVDQRWPAFEEAFKGFDPAAVAAFDYSASLDALCANPGLIRNRGKLSGTISNARTMVRLAEVYESFGRIIDALYAETYERRSAFMRSTFSHVGPIVAYDFLFLVGLASESDHPHRER